MLCTELCPPNSYVNALTPHVMVFGVWRGALWEIIKFKSGAEDGALRVGLVLLQYEEEIPELALSLTLSPSKTQRTIHMNTQCKGSCLQTRRKALSRNPICWHHVGGKGFNVCIGGWGSQFNPTDCQVRFMGSEI